MDPFSVICETCHSRLKVRDPNAIGQIHSCPKCESMVHIVPPAALAGSTLAGPAESEPVAATSTPDPASFVEAESAPATAFDDFSDVGLDLETMSSAVRQASESSATQSSVAPPVDSATVKMAAEAMAAREMAADLIMQPAAELFWRRVAIWSAAGGVGVFVLGAIVGALWMRSDRVDEVAISVPPTIAEAPAVDLPIEPDPNAVAESQPPVEPVSEPPPGDDGDEVEQTELVLPPPEDVHSDVTDADIADSLESEPFVAAGDPSLASVPTPPARKLDLLSFDPAFLDLAVGGSGTNRSSDESPSDPAQPIASFEPVDEPPTADGEPHSAGAEQLLPDADPASDQLVEPVVSNEPIEPAVDVRAPIRRGPPQADGPRRASIADQLEMPIDSIAMSGAPLHDWLAAMSDLISVPITLQPAALRMAGVAANAPVTVRSEDATAGDILRETLAAHRLAYEVRRGQLAVVRDGHARRRSSTYQVGELLPAGADDAAEIARLIEQFVAPETWSSRGGSGQIEVGRRSLRIENRLDAHLDVLVLLERMLMARDLQTKTRYPVERLTLDSSYARLASKLDTSTTFTFLAWSRLADVFRYWQDTSGVNVLVDWSSLADVDLASNSPVACSVENQRWEDLFDTLLEPLGLAWSAVDGETIQITSRDTARATRSIEFYPVADLVRRKFSGADAMVRVLRGVAESNDADSENAEFYYDEPSGYLLVLANGDAQRRLTARLTAM